MHISCLSCDHSSHEHKHKDNKTNTFSVSTHHQGWRGSKVTSDSGEVERTDGSDKALQRSVFESVPSVGALSLRSDVVYILQTYKDKQSHTLLVYAHTSTSFTFCDMIAMNMQ